LLGNRGVWVKDVYVKRWRWCKRCITV